MNQSIDRRRTQLQRQRQKIEQRVEQIQRNEGIETADDQTETAHEWENADVRDGVLDAAMRELGR